MITMEIKTNIENKTGILKLEFEENKVKTFFECKNKKTFSEDETVREEPSA